MTECDEAWEFVLSLNATLFRGHASFFFSQLFYDYFTVEISTAYTKKTTDGLTVARAHCPSAAVDELPGEPNLT